MREDQRETIEIIKAAMVDFVYLASLLVDPTREPHIHKAFARQFVKESELVQALEEAANHDGTK